MTGERVTLQSLASQYIANPANISRLYSLWSLVPITMQWTGGNVGMQAQQDQPEFKDFFRSKQISSCRAYFEVVRDNGVLGAMGDVLTDNPNIYRTWTAQLFRGAEDSPYLTGTSLWNPSTINPGYIQNAAFGKHGAVWSSLSPSWKCFLSGVDLRLLAFSATGRILDSDRRYV